MNFLSPWNLHTQPNLFPIYWEEPQNDPEVVVVIPPAAEQPAPAPEPAPAQQEPQELAQSEVFQLGQRIGILESENNRLSQELAQTRQELAEKNRAVDENHEPQAPQPETQPETKPAKKRHFWS